MEFIGYHLKKGFRELFELMVSGSKFGILFITAIVIYLFWVLIQLVLIFG